MTAQPVHVRPHPLPAAAGLSPEEHAIAEAVLYASLFAYPLTLAQLRQSLVESFQTPSQIVGVFSRSPALQAIVEYRDGFFFPAGRGALVAERRRREARSRRFLRRHRLLLALVCLIPYVRMAALSGSIAHLNLDRDGDLDLFIVTRGCRVWSVTVAVVVLAKLMGRRRAVCANYVIADSRLALEPQDLFSASQVIHLRPLVGRDVFRALVAANPFVARLFPNFHDAGPPAVPLPGLRGWSGLKRLAERVLARPWDGLELVCRRAYGAYLARRSGSWRSPDQVRLDVDCLKLHTRSHRRSVMERFERAVSAIDAER